MSGAAKKILYIDMDGVLVDFQSGIDRLSPELVKEYGDTPDSEAHYDDHCVLVLQLAGSKTWRLSGPG